MSAVSRLIARARGEIGYLEKKTNAQLDDKTANAGMNNFTKYARDLDRLGVYNGPKNGYAWCDVFSDWNFIMEFGLDLGMRMTYQPMGGYGAGCTESASYYKQAGRFFQTPEVGDQAFFSNDGGRTMYHTGIVVEKTSTTIKVCEGNTSSEPGVVPNGGAVREKTYVISYDQIAGFGRPNYALVEEEENSMDQKQFNTMFETAMLEYRRKLQDNDSSEYSAEARQWAIDSGLIVGNGTEAGGLPNYMWEDLNTREQLITVLYRFAKEHGLA